LAHAFASGLQPPLVHLVRVLDGVSHNAEQAFINSGEPANKVLEFFRSYGNVGTEPSQLLGYASALSCSPRSANIGSLCEVGLFQGHSAALFLALTGVQKTTYLSVDPQEFAFSPAVLRFLSARFPGRTTFIKGFSDHELDATKSPAMLHCDVWSIDGVHSPQAVSRDVRNALLASPKVSTILVDDLTDKLTTARRHDLDSLRGCRTAVDAWELAKHNLGTAFVSTCYIPSRKFGTSGYCSSWCVAHSRHSYNALR